MTEVIGREFRDNRLVLIAQNLKQIGVNLRIVSLCINQGLIHAEQGKLARLAAASR
jgi:hypothetical protein